MKTTKSSFTPGDTAILLVDHQPGVMGMIGSLPRATVANNAATLARLGEQLQIPLVITTTRETLEFLGTTLKEIQVAAPTAYSRRIRRAGVLNAFKDPKFAEAVAATKRPNLVIAGVLTDVCLSHSVFSALDAGYNVQVVADASGTTTPLADTVTYDRFRSLGAVVTSTYGILFELYPDLSTADGQKAQAVADASVGQSKSVSAAA